MLVEKVSGRTNVSISEIFKWVVEETESFLQSHARTELEYLYEKGFITGVYDPSNSKRKRRKNNWPERLLVDFSDGIRFENR